MPQDDDAHSGKASRLRERAEEMLKLMPEATSQADAGMLELIHELEVHQAELEIQNEELRRAQGEISGLHREFKDLYEFAPCGYVTLNPKGIVTRCNLSGVTLLGAEKSRLKGVGFSNFVAPERGDDFWTALKRAGTSGQKQSVELELTRTESEPVWVLADIQANRTETGGVSQWRLALVDITGRKRAEKELRDAHDELERRVSARTAELSASNRELEAEVIERKRMQMVLGKSEERFRTLVTATSQIVWTTDSTGEVADDIPTWRVYTGQSEQEVKGWGWIEALHPEDRLQTAEIWNQAVRSKSLYDTEYRLRRHDGEYRLFSARGVPILEDDGGIREWVGTCTDITEKRMSEKRLQQNVELLQTIVDGIGDPLIMLDKDGLVKMLNKAGRDYFDAGQAADALGKPCFQGLRDIETACPGCEHPFARVGSQKVAFERQGLKDERRVERVTIYPVHSELGQRDSFILTIADVTEAKLLTRQIFQNEKLAALGLVTSGVAHEINNPNSFIAFNLPILKQYLDALMPILDAYAALHPEFEVFHMSFQELKEDLFRLLENMEHGSQRINRIVETLRGFVTKREKEGLQPVDPKQLVDKVVTVCHAQIRRAVKSFEVLVREDLPPIYSDPDALEQVLLNLLINAVHASDKEDSQISLKVGQGHADSDAFIIEVSDNGSGIDDRDLGSIFEPFFTTKASTIGTGLGLYICCQHVESLGGRIEVESCVGKGSTFRVVLPQVNKA
ncbi:MAG: PAS domain S-box protein [Syntrophobacteraceae bacterium]